MANFKLPLRLQWIIYSMQNSLKRSNMPNQIQRVTDDPSSLPEYQRQVEFLRVNQIGKPYDCFQCRSFDIEIDSCCTPYTELYCGDKRRDRMCPGFNPPKNGKFEFVVKSVDNLV